MFVHENFISAEIKDENFGLTNNEQCLMMWINYTFVIFVGPNSFENPNKVDPL